MAQNLEKHQGYAGLGAVQGTYRSLMMPLAREEAPGPSLGAALCSAREVGEGQTQEPKMKTCQASSLPGNREQPDLEP